MRICSFVHRQIPRNSLRLQTPVCPTYYITGAGIPPRPFTTIMQSTTQISASTTILITLILVIALFPSLFHYAWTAPFSLIPFFGSSPSPVTDAEPRHGTATMWTQKQFTLQPKSRGSYLITDQVLQALPEIKSYKVGLLNLFVQHTSCALSLNENCE